VGAGVSGGSRVPEPRPRPLRSAPGSIDPGERAEQSLVRPAGRRRSRGALDLATVFVSCRPRHPDRNSTGERRGGPRRGVRLLENIDRLEWRCPPRAPSVAAHCCKADTLGIPSDSAIRAGIPRFRFRSDGRTRAAIAHPFPNRDRCGCSRGAGDPLFVGRGNPVRRTQDSRPGSSLEGTGGGPGLALLGRGPTLDRDHWVSCSRSSSL
jgi:hypothetical protein